MKFLNLLYRRETAAPMLALTFASAVSVVLVVARVVWTDNFHGAFLVWNLFLAWLPLIFALLACEQYRNGMKPGWRFLGFAGAWLLFFPNAPYIFTDLIHLFTGLYRYFWVDMVLILICALTGLVLGFMSLYLMQSVVRRMFGRPASWVFIALMTGFSGFGVYLGRVTRLNSWDVFVRPLTAYHRVGASVHQSFNYPSTAAFPILFAAFLFIAYLMLYALTQLPPTAQLASPLATKQFNEST
jgi:uncharacterized membrane protein